MIKMTSKEKAQALIASWNSDWKKVADFFCEETGLSYDEFIRLYDAMGNTGLRDRQMKLFDKVEWLVNREIERNKPWIPWWKRRSK